MCDNFLTVKRDFAQVYVFFYACPPFDIGVLFTHEATAKTKAAEAYGGAGEVNRTL